MTGTAACYRRWLILLPILGLVLTRCGAVPYKTHRAHAPKQPVLAEVKVSDESVLTQVAQKMNGYFTAGLLAKPIQLDTSLSATEAFNKSHEVAIALFDQNAYDECIEFINWIQFHIFQPPASQSFDLLKIVATYRSTLDPEMLIQGLQDPTLDIIYTPYQASLAYLRHALPVLARLGYTKLALSMVDKIFETYGPADSIYEQVENSYAGSPLQSSLIMEDYRDYKTQALSGLIYAQQILALYDQLRFTEAKTHSQYFLEHFPTHHTSELIEDVLEKSNQRGVWKDIRIALLLPLSGPYANTGKDIMDGILHAFKLFEEQEPDEGLLSFKFFPLDTHAYQRDLPQRVKDLIELESLFLIVGPYLAHHHRALIPVVQQYQIPMISLAPAQSLIGEESSALPVLNMRPSLDHQIKYMIDYVSSHIQPVQNLAIVYPDNGFGYFQANAFQAAADLNHTSISAAETYAPGEQKTYKSTIEKLLRVYDYQDRMQEREDLSKQYVEKYGREPQPNQITLDPLVDFELLYAPSPTRDASILVPLFKYLGAKKFLILGPSYWNNEEMVIRTKPYLENVILFDTFYKNEKHPTFMSFSQKFTRDFQVPFNKNHFWGNLTADILQKTLARLPNQTQTSRQDFLEQIQQVNGRTFFGQSWRMSHTGTLELDPIPLILRRNSFVRLSEESIAKLKETVFASTFEEE